jgi:hypothetical protein
MQHLRRHKVLQPGGAVAVADDLPARMSDDALNHCAMQEAKRCGQAYVIAH